MEATERPDMGDLFEAHAVFALAFDCESCDVRIEPPKEEKLYSDAWYRRLACIAKERKWFIPPPKDALDVMSAWCPACATRLGFTSR